MPALCGNRTISTPIATINIVAGTGVTANLFPAMTARFRAKWCNQSRGRVHLVEASIDTLVGVYMGGQIIVPTSASWR